MTFNAPVKLTVKSLRSKLTPINGEYPYLTELWGYLDSFLSFEVHNNFFIKAMSGNAWVRDIWDGRTHLFNPQNGVFPTGLLPYVLEGLKQFNIPYDFEDLRPVYQRGKEIPTKNLTPRQYQEDAVSAASMSKRGIIWARPRSGKCVNFDSLLLTQNGLLSFKELVGFHTIEKEFLLTLPLFGRTKEVKTAGVYCKGLAKTIILQTNNGFEIEGTPEHPILVWDTSICATKFKQLQNITKNDRVVIQRGQNYFGDTLILKEFKLFNTPRQRKLVKIPVKLTKNLARFFAYIIAEGSLTAQSRSIGFTNKDKNLVEDFQKISKDLFDVEVHKTSNDSIDYLIHSVTLKEFLNFHEIFGKAVDKKIPQCIRCAPQKYVVEFLRTFFECEGSVSKNIEISSASKELIRQLQILLLNFGIISKRLTRYNQKTAKNYWRLVIAGNAMQIFMQTIGFMSNRKMDTLRKQCARKFIGNNYDFIPSIQPFLRKLKDVCIQKDTVNWWYKRKFIAKGWRKSLMHLTQPRRIRSSHNATYLTVRAIFDSPEFCNLVQNFSEYQKIRNILDNNYYFDTVQKISQGQNYVVDFYVPEDHSFFANGFINHNTIMEVLLVSKLSMFPVLSICQSIDIAKQTKETFQKFLPGVKVGIIGDGECDIQDVTISTIQSLSAAYDIKENIPKKEKEAQIAVSTASKKTRIQNLVEKAKFVWVDECHHSVSNTHKFILQNKCYAAEYILGCSGTPFREDNKNLLMEGLLGPIIYEINYSRLINDGYLVRPTIHLIKVPKTLSISDDTSFASLYKQAVTENNLRNETIAKIASNLKSRGKSCMILVNKIKHGKELEKLIPGSRFSQARSKDRASLWHQLRVKQLKVLITTLGDEGVDIPSLDATIIAAGGESAIKVFQRLRCMTPFEGKEHAIVVDFLDPYKYLRKHSKKRERLYRSEPSFRVVYKEIKND